MAKPKISIMTRSAMEPYMKLVRGICASKPPVKEATTMKINVKKSQPK